MKKFNPLIEELISNFSYNIVFSQNNDRFNLDIKDVGKTMEIEMNNSVETVRKALLEKYCKSSTDILSEKELNLTDKEKLAQILNGIKESKDMEITYLGSGAFNITMF